MTEQTWSLEPWKGLLDYTKTMQEVVRSWETFFEGYTAEHFPKAEVHLWLRRVFTTFEALREQYVYDTLNSVQVHHVASGFPEMAHIRGLDHQYQLLKNEDDKNRMTSGSLRRLVLDDLFEHKRTNLWLLESTAKARAGEILGSSEPIHPFRIRSMSELETQSGVRAYICCFERFCWRHIPSLYLVIFECSGDGDLNDGLIVELARVLEEDTSNFPRLGNFAEKLDRAIAPIHPKWVGRISLGPVFLSHVTAGDTSLQKVLDELIPKGELVAASRIIYEYVIAAKAVPGKRLVDAKGRPHTELQDFAMSEFDGEKSERAVTHVSKFLFAPHAVYQSLPEEFRREIGHTYVGG